MLKEFFGLLFVLFVVVICLLSFLGFISQDRCYVYMWRISFLFTLQSRMLTGRFNKKTNVYDAGYLFVKSPVWFPLLVRVKIDHENVVWWVNIFLWYHAKDLKVYSTELCKDLRKMFINCAPVQVIIVIYSMFIATHLLTVAALSPVMKVSYPQCLFS